MLDATIHRASVRLAGTTSRRSFLGRLGAGVVALVGGPFVAVALDPSTAQAHHICGHTYTTGSCPHPYAPLSRIDRAGYPVHPRYGFPVDDLGRIYTSRDQRRRKICEGVVRKRFPKTGNAVLQGGWSRCCHGQIRRIVDCCSYSRTRINGDASLTGYCFGGRRVFCITYRDTNVPC
jgi:hypothetical protein